MPTAIEEVIQRQTWLKPIDQGLQQLAEAVLDRKGTVGQKIRNFLHGVWLGHPLHPVLTDIPIGAWTAAAVMDLNEILTGSDELNAGADAAVGIGLFGAAGAAVTGLNDWQYTSGSARRVGALHATLNIGATSLYLASLILRRRGNRSAGHTLGLLGLGIATASAYLGGKLVYDEKIGVDHAPREKLPDQFVPVLGENELPEGQPRRASANGVNILLVRRGGKIFALAETCAHMGGPLAEGHLEGDSIRCPWHGSRFCLETGRVLEGPAAFPQPCLDTRIRDGQIEVRLHRPGRPAARAETGRRPQPVS